MSTRDRRVERLRRAPAWRAMGALAAAAVLVAWLVGCGTDASPSASGPAGNGATTAAPALTATPTPTPAHTDTLRIGGDLTWYRGWWVGTEESGVPALTFGRLVYSGIYRYDGHDNAVPDLADGPCFVPGADGRVIRCRLVETTFQDGTPLTADDVAYTYRLFQRPVMNNCCTLTPNLEEVRVIDPRTVDFVLGSVDPTFLTGVLPMIPILSRSSIEAAVAAFDAETKDLTAKGLAKLADTIDREINADPQVCSDARVADVDALYRQVGWQIFHEDLLRANGTFDACGWLGFAAINLGLTSDYGGGLGWTIGQTGIDRVAGVVGWTTGSRPGLLAGSGPYRFVSQDVDRVHFEAWPGYHGGMAATKYVDFVRARGDGSDLDAGTVDILPGANLGAAYQATAPAHGVRVVTLPTGGYFALTFNVRSGHLFADHALRQALQLCIDLKRDVDAATGGDGTAIYGPVLPGSWGDDPDLPKPTRDTAEAKRLIEGAGWQLGADGIYAKGGVPLGARILVRADSPERVKMADLIASQARDCGMDIKATQITWDDITTMLGQYPHDIPGTKTPFDLYFAGWTGGPDPDMTSIYASSAITDAGHPDGTGGATGNFGGFSDPAFDRLIAAGQATYDQAERTRIYRLALEELASQLPAIFLWAMNSYDALRSVVTTVDGPLDITAPNWAWQPERMVVAAAP
jgi:ABC-type transport system substrate-binding protein